MFEPLKKSELDTGMWENGADISPDFLYEIGVSAVDHASVME